jgi:membrane fusion protein (multidrug efflux system)
MNRTIKRVIIYLLLLAVLLVIVAYRAGWFSDESAEPVRKARNNNEALPVSGFIVTPGGLTDRIVATGTVMANEAVLLSAEVSGRITSINFVEGSLVTKGTVLATINDAELVAQLEKNAYNQKLAEERERRQRHLLEKEAVSQEEYDRVLTDLNTVKAEASLIKAQLQKAKIVAPFTGTIGLRQVSEGAFVTPGQRIATLTQLQPVKIEFSVPERFAGSIRKDSKVNFSLEGDSTRFVANVYAIEPSVDPETRSVTIRAIYPNKNMELRPGNFTRIEFELQHFENALQVPAQALIPELGGNKVYIYKGGKAEEVKVGVGIRTSSMVQITQGLIQGDTVITSGILQLRSGLPVIINNVRK